MPKYFTCIFRSQALLYLPIYPNWDFGLKIYHLATLAQTIKKYFFPFLLIMTRVIIVEAQANAHFSHYARA
jgi:hypothetical protein